MSYFKKLTFLKVLTTVAWADGEMTESELSVLKRFYRKFDLGRDELNELKPYLAAPVSKKERDGLYETLVGQLSSPDERKDIQNAMAAMLEAHPRAGTLEKDLVEEFSKVLDKTSFTKRSLVKFRNLLQSTLFQGAREKDSDMEKYFKRKVLNKIELKLSALGKKISISDDQVYYLCLLGSLLALVANVDNHLDENEQKALKRVLGDQFAVKGQELQVLFDVIVEQARKGFDFHEVVSELNNLIPQRDRLKLVDSFFAVAAADGDLTHDEAEEIRRITKGLRIQHKDFIASKVKFLHRLRQSSR